MVLVRAQGAEGGPSLQCLSGDLEDQRGQHQGWARALGAQGKSRWEPRKAVVTGSLGGQSGLCALRVCSVLHNQGKLLKWGEPEGVGKGGGSTAPPP